ncbi:flavin-dependent oxidoreductase, F420-dependent methylene-tetrahydromethanopterin reductase [Mycobacteroides abscessus subsp. bolletii]|uniref:LLM class flavin-dependent oxidoreductase n=1 Tax=Mycobacteroides abscessus TaxID=36809 RepID=UPI0009A5A594|nr:LLM class flavin-dependent oxidoreductase [Mycobacteroides abscessus]SKG71439.1 flavin-dependent oxidoreductase, F420-dependent methylene-tetrahydromethanopterin reductase [Mycobacteroides abscessus subsp. bolletii]SKH11044.1 flavin-dependent oxidoreductase, F420-dependent methylene-tetrahydromethanopterin reductase [Mycobacteroides abscessus subsp. bolletii]
MRVYVTLGPDQSSAAADAAAAEAAGFDGVSTGEHLFFHGPMPNAFISLAAAAGATSRVRLLSSLTLLPLYPPALAAKLATSLDQVSAGRFELGVGVGGEYPAEFTAAGVPVGERGRRADEALELMSRLFTGAPTHFQGRYATVPGLRIDPPPAQGGGPPIWVGGRRAAAIRRAGRHGDVWFPYMYSPEQLHHSLSAVRQAAERAGRDPAQIRAAIHCWGGVDDDAARSRSEVIAAVSDTYQQDFTKLVDRYLLHGTPEDVAGRIDEYREAGADCVVFAPVGAGERRDRIIDMFAEHVLPNISGKIQRSTVLS